MIGVNDLQILLGDTLFNGNYTAGGLAIFMMAFIVLIAFCQKNILMVFLASLPMIFLFWILGVLSQDMMVLLLLVDVLGLGLSARRLM